MTPIDMNQLVDIVRQTGAFLRDKEEAARITTKRDNDFVTAVDYRVQEELRKVLTERWPEIQFMSEENDNASLDLNGSMWILDPVDGTTNLIHDFRHSAISLGLCEQGEVTCGVVYDPYADEAFYAQKGKGAYLNGEPIHVANAKHLSESLVTFGTTPYERNEFGKKNFELFYRIFMACVDIRALGSAAMELAYVACGRVDAYFETNLKPWDYAAGTILVREAGGVLTTYTGADPVHHKNIDLVAANAEVAQELRDKLAED